MQRMQETQVWSLDWEDPLKESMATHSSVLAWRIPWTEEPGGYSPRDCKESDTTERMSTQHTALKLAKLLNINISHLFSYRLLFKWNNDRSCVSILWPDVKNQLIGKDPDAKKDCRQEEKGMTEDEMVGWHHRLSGHKLEQTLGDSEGEGNLACYSLWSQTQLSDWRTTVLAVCLVKIMSLGIVLAEGKPSSTEDSISRKMMVEARGEVPCATNTMPMCPTGPLSGCRHPWISEQLREKHDRIGF